MSNGRILPLVTVVTPSYNQAQFLEQTIRSVLAQDYAAIEYVVVDGASTDNSVAIIKKYASQLQWWVSEPDQGQADAINKGLLKANGEIVAWLNSDDLYLPGAVAAAVDVFQAQPDLGFVYGDAITIDISGRPINRLAFPDWSLEDLMAFRILCQPAVFMRKEVLEHVGFLDESYHYMLDHQLWLRIAELSSFQHISKVCAAARYHPAAKNVSHAEQFSLETYHVFTWMENQPELSHLVKQNRRKILAGAYRLSARYLLDGGLYSEALKTYWRAFVTQPRYALHHWHRIIYAILCLVGGSSIGDWVNQKRPRKRLDLNSNSELNNWDGLKLDG